MTGPTVLLQSAVAGVVEAKDVKSGGGCVRPPPSGSLGLPRPSLLQANFFMLNFVAMDYDLANYLLLMQLRLLETSNTCFRCAVLAAGWRTLRAAAGCAVLGCWLANASGCCWLRCPRLLAAAAVCWALTCELSLRLLLSFLTPRFTRDV